MKIAAFTMAHNEAIFLPVWLSYYGSQFGRNNCFVIDHGSSDGSTSGLGWNCLRLPSSSLDEIGRADLVGRYQRFLLSSYDAVVFSDTDEILVADPERYGSLGELVERTSSDIIAGVGLALTHAQDIEKTIDYRHPILHQRRFVRFQDIYCKPLIGKTPIDWQAGFHRCNGKFVINKKLYIFHLKAIDIAQSISDLAKKRAVELSDRSRSMQHNVQFSFSEAELIDTYFPFKGDDFVYKPKDEFSFDRYLQSVAAGRLSGLKESFKEGYELPDRLRVAF